jgi:heat shock protein HtpX
VVLVGIVSIIANIMTRLLFFGGRGRRSTKGSGGGIIMIVVLVIGVLFIIISPVVAMIIRMAISRNREYLADSTGALISRYPPGLANALKKISSNSEVKTASSATAHLFISNPLGKKSRVMFKSLFNSHPPVKERIERLNEMSLGVLTK